MARKKLDTLTEQMYYVLLALWGGPRHGYGIMQHTSEVTHGQVAIGAGTLYALLGRFEAEGLISLIDARDGGRKSYQLTEAGRQALREEYARLWRRLQNGAGILWEGNET